MNIVIPDDYQDTVRSLDCFAKLAGHDVTIFNDTAKDLDTLAERFRDADARPGLLEETAPGARVASRRTADGYDLEVAIPWSAMPAAPRPGGTIGLNVVLYDGDDAKAPVGANVSESGLAWAAFPWGGKQALPYVWPRAVLGPSGSR